MLVPKSHQRRGCKKFVVRPSGGSLYLGFRLITNFRLKAELRTSCFYTVSQLVDRSYPAYRRSGARHSESLQIALMGLQKLRSSLLLCRQSMNDPPTSLVVLTP